MVSSFDVNKLKKILYDFHNLTGMSISVYDENFETICYAPEEHYDFCFMVRTDPAALKNCRLCDKKAIEIAVRQHTPYTYQCHAGLTESIIPIYMGNIVLGYIYLAHNFCYATHEEGWKNIYKCCQNYHLDFEKLKELCYKAPLVSINHLLSAENILAAVASFLCLEQMAYLKNEDLGIQIDNYISEHLTENLDASLICERFNISRTTLYNICMKSYGVGIATHIRNLRIKKAKKFLSQNFEMSINEVAYACGFDDYNYFITMFKRVTGTSPNQYRKRFKTVLSDEDIEEYKLEIHPPKL